jgi:ArsR family transcriptional regulator
VNEQRTAGLPAVDTAGPMHCPPMAAGPFSDVAATQMASRLRVLSHPVRIKLLSMLFAAPRGEECGRVLATTIGLPETTISHHLRQLRVAGFIESRRCGMHVYHRPHPRALNALLATFDPDAEPDSTSADRFSTRRSASVGCGRDRRTPITTGRAV